MSAELVVPVLFLVFNRPETTRQVFDAIRLARPRSLYVAADGARPDRPGEYRACAEVRAIATAVEWNCEVHTLFREENLGCQRAITEALDWFFEAEEQGIILEDDCLPDPSFFPYCQELLDVYRTEERVLAVSGDNFQAQGFETEGSYYFSRYPHVWGWATWRRAWQLYDGGLSEWPTYRDGGTLTAEADGDKDFADHWSTLLDRTAAGDIETWDYQWMFTAWLRGGLACLPARNLVSNIGAGAEATHTRKEDGWALAREREPLSFPLKHPSRIARHVEADRFTERRVHGIGARHRVKRPLLGSLTLRRIVEEFKSTAIRLLTREQQQ